MSEFHVVIPTRYGSTRFPGKPLYPLLGKPMVLHVVDRARASSAASVVVATDDARIEQVCLDAGVDVVMTRADHPSGTDRIAEVADRKAWPADTCIVGVQGDEPAIPSAHIELLAKNLHANPTAAMASLCFPCPGYADWVNADRVKVVTDHLGFALYFSRAPIPHWREVDSSTPPAQARIHIGIYAYRRAFLQQYTQLKPSRLESLEQLEQLRVLDAGFKLHMGEVSETVAHGVDRFEDVASMEIILKELTSR